MKYANKPTVVDGIKFDSKAEAKRFADLLLLQKAGRITDLKRQWPFVLAPGVKIAGEKRARPALRFIADFCYIENGRLVVEDVKSPATAKLAAFRIKTHLMKTVHAIDVRVVS